MVRLGIATEVRWDQTHELLAGIIETVDEGNRYFVKAWKKKGSADPRPRTVRRPWQRRQKSRVQSMADPAVRRFFGGRGGAVSFTRRKDPGP